MKKNDREGAEKSDRIQSRDALHGGHEVIDGASRIGAGPSMQERILDNRAPKMRNLERGAIPRMIAAVAIR